MSEEKKEETKEYHILRHKNLHRSLDELVADFITHTEKILSNTTVMELIEWSYSQVINPTPSKE